jgi:integrase
VHFLTATFVHFITGGDKTMSAYKDDKTGTWYAYFRYSDWTGDRKQKMKRGFPTKREALEWERAFLQKTAADLSISFESFTEVYFSDMRNRIREYTWLTKENIIKTKLIPFFGKKKMNEIQTRDVIAWQNEMLAYRDAKGKGYSETYLKTMHNQLSAVLNHAVRHYELKSNAASKVGPIGKKEAKEMLFWTKDEYIKFADAMMDKPLSFYAFEILYWCGLRLGELLALTPADFDFEKETVSVTKSYQRLSGRDVVTEPKTQKSNRIISMPTFLCEEIQEYLKMIYRVQPTDRIFTITKSYLHHEMDRGSKASGVKRIRVHDIRHSHVSLLIEMGFSALAIADRVGHESIDITYRYAHLFPTKQTEIANKLNIQRGEDN